MFIIKIFILIALVKFLIHSDAPFVCAGIYCTINFLLCLAFGQGLFASLIYAAIIAIFSVVFFWLLDRFEDNWMVWWPVAIIGIIVGSMPEMIGLMFASSSMV